MLLGMFLVPAARDPLRNLTLIWFTVRSSVVHAAIMAIQAFLSPDHKGHLGRCADVALGSSCAGFSNPKGKTGAIAGDWVNLKNSPDRGAKMNVQRFFGIVVVILLIIVAVLTARLAVATLFVH